MNLLVIIVMCLISFPMIALIIMFWRIGRDWIRKWDEVTKAKDEEWNTWCNANDREDLTMV